MSESKSIFVLAVEPAETRGLEDNGLKRPAVSVFQVTEMKAALALARSLPPTGKVEYMSGERAVEYETRVTLSLLRVHGESGYVTTDSVQRLSIAEFEALGAAFGIALK